MTKIPARSRVWIPGQHPTARGDKVSDTTGIVSGSEGMAETALQQHDPGLEPGLKRAALCVNPMESSDGLVDAENRSGSFPFQANMALATGPEHTRYKTLVAISDADHQKVPLNLGMINKLAI